MWRPIERVALLERQGRGPRSINETKFMFLGTALDPTSEVAIHLYKHYDTRRHLNLDDAGRAYARVEARQTTTAPSVSTSVNQCQPGVKYRYPHDSLTPVGGRHS
ncbi:MAG: hypothetical protein M3N95_06835 [Actinomycetota bacterium]|nr:hypothetical protein [Actinomycetota bacterium]